MLKEALAVTSKYFLKQVRLNCLFKMVVASDRSFRFERKGRRVCVILPILSTSGT